MKKIDLVLKDYFNKMSSDDLKLTASKLDLRIGSDVADVLNLVSMHLDINKWLLSSKTNDELYDMLDTMMEYVDRELNKRESTYVYA